MPRRKRSKREVEFGEFVSAARRFIRAAGRRAEVLDPADLPALLSLRDVLDQAIGQAVAAQVEFGFSWGDIAAGLGCSRQNAYKRFARYCHPHAEDRVAS